MIIQIMQDLSYCTHLIRRHFNHDEEKTIVWMNSSNPLLGGQVPTEMIISGRGAKVIEFIESSLSDGCS